MSNVLTTEKEKHRRAIADKRNALETEEASRLASIVVRRFLGSWRDLGVFRGMRVALYKATRGELSLFALKEPLLDAGAELCFPRVLDSPEARMEMARIKDPTLRGSWTEGRFGILEPPEHAETVAPAELDVVIVPGVVFDREGHRLGWGGGFYDRFLPRARGALRVALAYDLQIEPEEFRVSPEEWDEPIDWLISERREFRTPRLKSWLDERGLGSALK